MKAMNAQPEKKMVKMGMKHLRTPSSEFMSFLVDANNIYPYIEMARKCFLKEWFTENGIGPEVKIILFFMLSDHDWIYVLDEKNDDNFFFLNARSSSPALELINACLRAYGECREFLEQKKKSSGNLK